MEDLIRPWRETYRSYDGGSDHTLCAVPSLANPDVQLDHSTIETRSNATDLLSIRRNVKALSALIAQRIEADTVLPTLTTIPSLESAAEQGSWCSDFVWRPQKFARVEAIPEPIAPIVQTEEETEAARLTASVQNATEDFVLKCVVALLDGLESDLFEWSPEVRSFDYRSSNVRLEYLSYVASRSVIDECMERGTCIRRLSLWADSPLSLQPSTVHTKLTVFVRQYLQYCSGVIPSAYRGRTRRSLLSLCHLLSESGEALLWLCSTIGLGNQTGLSKTAVQLLNDVTATVSQQTGIYVEKDKVVREVFHLITASLMEEVGALTGLGPELERTSFALQESRANSGNRLHLLSDHHYETVSEIHKGIDFLKRYADKSIQDEIAKMKLLHIQYSTFHDDLLTLESRAMQGGEALAALVKTLSTVGEDLQPAQQHNDHLSSRHEISNLILTSLRSIQTQEELDCTADVDFRQTLDRHDSDDSTFDLTQCSRICLDLPLNLQKARVHKHVLDVLLHRLNLQNHLDLLSQVFLLTNGNFSARLSMAIFSSQSGSLGINYHNKKAPKWPPSSAKVSVATRTLLLDSIDKKYMINSEQALSEREFLGHLGIMMSLDDEPEELPRDSLDALSFLKFGFRPPKPLDMIITVRSLTYYSRINEFLLMLLRMTNAGEQLTMQARLYRTMRKYSPVAERFRIEATNFIRAFVAHIHETVIGTHWSRFQQVLERGDMTIDALRIAHESTLEQICNSCLITRKMKEIQTLLRTVFSAVLAFGEARESDDDDAHVRALYTTFRSSVRKFVAVLVGAEATKRDSFAVGATARFALDDHWSSA